MKRRRSSITRPFREIRDRLLGIRDTPEAIARGIALGLFVAFTPTLGGQMVIVILLCMLFRANRIAGVAMVWITNPLTIVPFCYVWYKLGLFFLSDRELTYDEVQALFPRSPRGFFEGLIRLVEVFGTPLWVGSLVFASVSAAIAYPLALRHFRRRVQQATTAGGGGS